MEIPLHSSSITSPLTDRAGLRMKEILPLGKEPSIRTLFEWTELRPIPRVRVGHFVHFDIENAAVLIRPKPRVPARG